MEDSSFADFFNEDGDENDESTEWISTLRDGVIFLIDCTSTMITQTLSLSSLTQVKEEDAVNTGIRLGLLCCQTFMQNKAISSADDLIGLVLMRTANSSSGDFEGVNIVQTLDLASAQRILELERLRQMPLDEFQNTYGTRNTTEDGGFPIHEGLWACQNLFNKSPKSLGYKRIFLLTDDPDPVSRKAQFKRQAIAKVMDLRQSNIELEVLPILQEGIEFDFNIFYKNLQQEVDGEESCQTLVDPTQRLEELLTRVNSRALNHHRLARLPFFLVPSLSGSNEEGDVDVRLAIGVSAYCLIRSAGAPKQIRLAASTNAPVSSQRRFYKVPKGSHDREDPTENPENLVLPQDIVKGVQVGSRNVCFDRHELAGRMKQFVSVGIHLLGFKPLKCLRPWYHLRTAQFIYPDEGLAKGSSLWFSTLLSVCLSRRVFAFAIYVQRKGIAPHLVALAPQAEKVDEEGAQLNAPGFNIVFLPFLDDFRSIKLPNFPAANTDEVDKAKVMVKNLLIPYDPENVGNPRLLRHYAELEALALERCSAAEDVPDHTMPNLKVIKRRAGEALDAFQSTIGLDDSSFSASPPVKRQKREAGSMDEQLTVDHLVTLVQVDGLAKLTVPRLKQAIALLRLRPISSRKADLIEAITSNFTT